MALHVRVPHGRDFPKLAGLVLVIAVLSGHLSAADRTRYFKADAYTDATYIALKAGGRYTITAREHMGVWLEESGRWSRDGRRITFTPDKQKSAPYALTEVVYRDLTFLAQEGEPGPSIAVSIDETEHALDHDPKRAPPYVFFEISASLYRRETKLPYPFHTRPKIP